MRGSLINELNIKRVLKRKSSIQTRKTNAITNLLIFMNKNIKWNYNLYFIYYD